MAKNQGDIPKKLRLSLQDAEADAEELEDAYNNAKKDSGQAKELLEQLKAER